jgi:tetratricopeptide (TPR) repeat protein
MDKQHDKFMTDLHRLLGTQDFKNEDDLKSFLGSITGKKIPSFSKNALTNKEKAQDLVMEAYELTPVKAKKNIAKALELDPDCIEAYEYLGASESSLELAIAFLEKGIAIGRKLFFGENFEYHKGHFWSILETRPFMRCLQLYSEVLYLKNKKKECVKILEEMIDLNPNDNQGVRDQLMLYLIELDEFKKFDKYANMFKEDEMTFSLFNQALFTFKTEGDTTKSKIQLQKALKQNKFVAEKLISGLPILELSDHYGFGDENEADYYVDSAQHIWRQTKGAMEWLKKQSK